MQIPTKQSLILIMSIQISGCGSCGTECIEPSPLHDACVSTGVASASNIRQVGEIVSQKVFARTGLPVHYGDGLTVKYNGDLGIRGRLLMENNSIIGTIELYPHNTREIILNTLAHELLHYIRHVRGLYEPHPPEWFSFTEEKPSIAQEILQDIKNDMF